MNKYSPDKLFSHEFTHFLEKWNPLMYNEFRRVVFAELEAREANALKEQIGGTVRYAENIVKMFDEMAVQAVENYQATVATEETAVNASENAEKSINPENIDSIQGINSENNAQRGTDNVEREETNRLDRGAERSTSKTQDRTRTENEDGSRVQEEMGGRFGENSEETSGRIRLNSNKSDDKTWLLNTDNCIIPEKGSELEKAQNILLDEYGIESHVLKSSGWYSEHPAAAFGKKVYFSGNAKTDDINTMIYHASKQEQTLGEVQEGNDDVQY